MRFYPLVAGIFVAAALGWATLANAQVAGGENETQTDEPGIPAAAEAATPGGIAQEQFDSQPMDEIEVVVGPQGQSAYELEMQRVELLKEALYNDIRMRDRGEEEQNWRQADPDLDNPESRIKWGYSPQAEQRMRREYDYINDSGIDQVKPASLFRIEF